jgi:hypothetical protein
MLTLRSLRIFVISFLIPPPFITILGAVTGILVAHKFPDSVVPFILAGLPFAIVASFITYSIPVALVSIFIVFCPFFYKNINYADDASLIVSGLSFGIFYGIISEFKITIIVSGAIAGIISTLVSLIATKNLRARDYLSGHT